MIDYYEFLQISPNADFDTVQRVYRYLAARFHPDNTHTGDAERFHLLRTAYEVLSDRTRRSQYDAARKTLTQEPLSSSIDFMDSLEGELNRRLAVLAVLYQRRRANAHFPEVALAEIEERMGFPRDYLDFTLWYLVKKRYINKSDNGHYALTAEGVDFVEAQRPSLPVLNKMLTSGREPTDEEIDLANRLSVADPEFVRQAQFALAGLKSRVLGDRRSGLSDRRVGAPDFREVKLERRKGPGDRRGTVK